MDNKILIEIVVPILEQSYNAFIPVGKSVAQITELFEKMLIELSDGAYEKQIGVALYDASGKIIEPGLIVKNSGINNGSRLIII